MSNLINLTPHAITLLGGDNSVVLNLPSSGTIARVSTQQTLVDTVNGISIFTTTFGDLVGLPDAIADTYYVVSVITAQAATLAGRTDVLVVNDAVRDGDGRIIGCRSFGRV